MPITRAGAILRDQLRVSPDIVVEFIALYSRLEFALKRANYVLPVRPPDEFIIHWDRFTADLAPAFSASASAGLTQAVAYLRERPPMREVWTGREVDWKGVAPDRGVVSLSSVLAHVRRARNNLFHGGKFATAPDDPARNKDVLMAGLAVLNEVIDLSQSRAPEVHAAFHSPNY